MNNKSRKYEYRIIHNGGEIRPYFIQYRRLDEVTWRDHCITEDFSNINDALVVVQKEIDKDNLIKRQVWPKEEEIRRQM